MIQKIENINTALEGTINNHLNNGEQYSIENIKKTILEKNKEFQELTENTPNVTYIDKELNLLAIIESAREMMDLDCGIISTKISKEESKISIVGREKKDDEKNPSIVIRDGRFKDYFVDGENKSTVKSHPSESKYSWIANMAITAQGANDLLGTQTSKDDSDGDKKITEELLKKSLEAMKATENPKDYKKILLNFNWKIQEHIKERKLIIESEKLDSDKKIAKAIDTSKHYAQLKLDHSHNITISKGKKEDENIVQTNLIVNSNYSGGINKGWSDGLKGVQKGFFEKNKALFEKGEKVISSQIKNGNGMPVLANAFL